MHEELPWALGGGRCFRPAASLGLPGNGFQPAVRQGRSGVTYESGDEDNCRGRPCSCGGGRSPSWRSSDSAVQGFGNFRHRRHLVAGSTSRAYSRGKVSGLPLRQSVRPFRGWSSSDGSSRRWSARIRESTARAQAGSILEERRVSRQVKALSGIPPDQEVEAEKAKIGCPQCEAKGVAAVSGGRTQAGKYREWCRWRESGKDAGTRGVPQTWPRRTTSLEEEVCISYAQAALSANNSWSTADTAASLQQLQKASEGGLSVGTLGVHVLHAVAAGVSPLGDLVREVLLSSFTMVKASGKSVRQRDLLPLPVPWSWAPFAEFLWQTVDEHRHRSSPSGAMPTA